MDRLDYHLGRIQEWGEQDMVDCCKKIECPRKRIKCLLRMRLDVCAGDQLCQTRIDREIDMIYQSFDNQGGPMIKPLISAEEFPELYGWY